MAKKRLNQYLADQMSQYFKIGKLAASHGLKGDLVLEHSLGKQTALKGLEHIFIPDSDTAKKGSPGKDVFSFKALKAGETTVSFAFKPEYSRHVNRVEEYTFIIKKQ